MREAERSWWDGTNRLRSAEKIETQPQLAADLEAEGIYNRVYIMDFLQLSPETTGLYDKIVMNPPFDRERDIDHVMHAIKILKEDGQLVSITSAHTQFAHSNRNRLP